jgi:ubiquinone/menaquinone biosynthesis C-methylase UbiE
VTQTARIAGLFDALAGAYDNVGVDFFRPIARDLLTAMPPRRGERWLDIGCGRGAVLLPAAEAIGPEGRAVGLDISSAMVEQTRSLAQQRRLGNVEVRVADAHAPSLDGERFGTISSCLVLFFLAEPAAALRTWLDLLEPGGRLGVTTFGPEDPRWESVDEVFEPYLSKDVRDARTSGKAGPFASHAGMEQMIRDAGYEDVRTAATSIPVRFASLEQWHAFTWSTGQRMMWLSVPEDRRPEVLAQAQGRLAAFAGPDGSVVFDQGIRHTLATRPR